MANAGRSSQRATGRRACRASRVRVTARRPRGGSQRPPCRRAPPRSRARSQGPGLTLRGRRPGPRLNGWKTASSSAGSKPVPVSSTVDGDRLAVGGRGDLHEPAWGRVPQRVPRSGCRAPAGPGCRRAPTIASGASASRATPAASAVAANARRLSSTRATSDTGERCVGICPRSARASTSRPSATRTRCSTSADAPTRASRRSPGAPPPGQGGVDLGLQDRERRSQLVARVVDEPALPLERLLEPVEGEVQGHGEAGERVVGRGHRQPVGRVGRRDGRRLAAHALDRAKGRSGQRATR